MQEFFNQFFDFSFMVDHFDEVLERVLDHDPALRRQRRPGADLGADPGHCCASCRARLRAAPVR